AMATRGSRSSESAHCRISAGCSSSKRAFSSLISFSGSNRSTAILASGRVPGGTELGQYTPDLGLPNPERRSPTAMLSGLNPSPPIHRTRSPLMDTSGVERPSHAETIAPHGGERVDLLLPPAQAERASEEARHLPKIEVGRRELHDLEMLAVGALSALRGFM